MPWVWNPILNKQKQLGYVFNYVDHLANSRGHFKEWIKRLTLLSVEMSLLANIGRMMKLTVNRHGLCSAKHAFFYPIFQVGIIFTNKNVINALIKSRTIVDQRTVKLAKMIFKRLLLNARIKNVDGSCTLHVVRKKQLIKFGNTLGHIYVMCNFKCQFSSLHDWRWITWTSFNQRDLGGCDKVSSLQSKEGCDEIVTRQSQEIISVVVGLCRWGQED